MELVGFITFIPSAFAWDFFWVYYLTYWVELVWKAQ